MKWVMLISSIDAQDGGPSLAMLKLATALSESGEQVHLCTISTPGREVHPAVGEAVKSGVTISYARIRRHTSFMFAPTFMFTALRRSRHVDVVTLHGFYQFSTIVAWLLSVFRRAPLLIEPHGVFEPYQVARGSRLKPVFMFLVGRRAIRRCRSLMAASPQERAGIEESLGSATPVTVVGLGVTIPRVQTRRKTPGREVLFLSRLAPKKRLDKLLAAAYLLHQSGEDVHLTVCGDGDPAYVSELKRMDQAPGTVTWCGHVDGDPRRRIEDVADLFVLPTDNENFGLAVVEAMAVGIPVITTRNAGASEHVLASQGGWVLTDPTIEELAGAIQQAFQDPARLADYGRNARHYTINSLSWATVANRWLALVPQN